MKKIALCLLFIVAVFGVGCQNYGFIKKDEFDKKIDAVKTELADKLEGKNQEIIKEQTALIRYKDGMAKDAAGFLYGALAANYLRVNPDRIDYIQRVRMEAAFAKLPSPDAQVLLDERKALTTELDEKNTTLAQLEKKYKDKEDEAKKQKEIIAAKEKDIQDKEAEKTKLVKDAADKTEALRKAQHEKDQEIIAKQTEDLKAKEAREKQIRILIYIFTGVGVAAGIAAYLLKSLELGGVAAIAIGLAVLVAVMEPWQLIASILAMFGLIWLGFYRKYRREKSTKENVIGAVQEAKQMASEEYKNILQPKLKEWFAQDKKGEKHVEETLKELNLK